MNVTEKINAIVAERAKHLPDIQREREHLLNIKQRIDELEALVGAVNNDMVNQSGPYYKMMNEDPKMEIAFRNVNTGEVKDLISKQLRNLDVLERRFSRKTISIAMIGYERQGKSTFLQTISGLENNVIPAYSGTSCTGAVSVIHNIDGDFRAEIEMFTEQEFLKIVNDKLENFFPERRYNINSIYELKKINLSGFSSQSVTLSTEFNKFREAYCEHVDDYANLIGTNKITIYEKANVIKHVAQYEEFGAIPAGEMAENFEKITKNDGSVIFKKNYYKYIAVKSINIFTKFEMADSAQIELIDTIGLGDSSNANLIEKEMFRVLKEDCDAAVNLFKPDALGSSFNDTQTKVLNKILEQLKDREPSKWIVYVVNKVGSGIGANTANIPAIMNQITKTLGNMPVKPVAWVKDIQGNNPKEVKDKLVNPLLDLITNNLGDLDKNLMAEADAVGAELYSAYFKLTNQVSEMMTGSIKSKNEGALFDKLFKNVAGEKGCLYSALREIDEDVYAPNKNKPCPEIEESLKQTIKSLYDILPEESAIREMVNLGIYDQGHIFSHFCDSFINSTFKEFEKISEDIITPLREKVKTELVSILYNKGLLNRIVLEKSVQGETIEWLKCLIDERVNKEAYPSLYEALMYIYNYSLNIEDTIEYHVAKSLGCIDKMNVDGDDKFIPFEPISGSVDERANAIWDELVNRIPLIQPKLKEEVGIFALIPSHSFSTRISKFRIKMREENVKDDLRNFYRDNELSLWRDDFTGIIIENKALKEWKEVSDALIDLRKKEYFEL